MNSKLKRLDESYKTYEFRRKEAIKRVISWIVAMVITFSFYFLFATYWPQYPILRAFAVLAALAFIGIFLGFFYMLTKIFVEPVETKIFAKLYDASRGLELYFKDKFRSKNYLVKTEKNLSSATNEIRRFRFALPSSLMLEEIDEHLKKLRDGLEKRILPQIRQGKNLKKIQQKLEELAFIFSENPRVEKIVNFNKTIEFIPETIRPPAWVKISTLWRSKPGQLGFSLVFGYFLVVCIIAIFSYLSASSFADSVQANLSSIIVGGAALSSLVYVVVFVKR